MELERGNIVVKTSRRKFVFKPFDFFGDGFRTVPFNEVLAYNIGSILGFNVIPKTELMKFNLFIGGREVTLEGSAQVYVDGVVPIHHFGGTINKRSATEVLVLDTLLGNTDRKDENLLVDEAGRLFAVDNGFTLGFHTQTERDRRGDDYPWNLSLLSLEDSYLNITERLTEAVDLDYLEEIVKQIQRKNYSFKLEDSDFDKEIGNEIVTAIHYRIKYLPKLTWDQLRGLR